MWLGGVEFFRFTVINRRNLSSSLEMESNGVISMCAVDIMTDYHALPGEPYTPHIQYGGYVYMNAHHPVKSGQNITPRRMKSLIKSPI